MFKRMLLVVAQAILFLALFGIGSFLPAFGILPMVRVSAGQRHYMVLDGIILMLIVYVLIMGIEAMRKRIKVSGSLTTFALVLGFVLGLAMKFGLMAKSAGV